jgi:hypothetical protein
MLLYHIENIYLSVQAFSCYNRAKFILEMPLMLNLLMFIPLLGLVIPLLYFVLMLNIGVII